MTLKTLLYNIAQYAIGNKIINYSAAGPSLYGLNMETIKDYPVLFASPTGNHNITPNLTTYTITLYYIDRLTRGGDNDIDVLSTSVEGLKSIISGIKYLPGVIEIYDDYNITNFADTQKMSDNVAGAYATITIRTANNSTCPDGGIISNGGFIPNDNIVVKNQNKNLIINENGNYTLKPDNGYTGLGRVIVKVDVPDDNGSYEEGYEEGNKVGIEAGKRIQKELMQPITITSNGTYIREDGYSEVVVDVDGDESKYEEGYQDGYNQGEEDQKAKLTNITITNNGTYTSEDGYGEVVVNVEGGFGGDCEEAYEQGKADQKALMITTKITRNGTYTREDGYNEVVVNVPSTLYPKFFGVLSDTIGINYHNIYDYMGSDGEIWAGQLWGYVEQNQDKTSNGMMYEFDYYSGIDRAPIANIYMGNNYNLDVLNLSSTIDYNFNSWGLPVWGKKSLVTPWVYNVNNSPTTTKILPDCILGGFECGEVEYINRVFEGAEKLRVFQWLHNLGKSFTSVNTLDLSVLTKLNYDIYGVDSFIEIANSVYDFAVDGMNVNGISYSNVKLPSTVSQEAIDAWIAKGWRVLQ